MELVCIDEEGWYWFFGVCSGIKLGDLYYFIEYFGLIIGIMYVFDLVIVIVY